MAPIVDRYDPPLLALVAFAAGWAVAIYLINSAIARRFKHIDPRPAALHVVTMAVFGAVGEIGVDGLYHLITGDPLWSYTVYPTHDGYTSLFAPFLWGIVGLHLYLMHGTLEARERWSVHRIALVFCGESVILEAAANLSYGLIFGRYLFPYLPGDLWHVTTVQTLPFYLPSGYVIVGTLRRLESRLTPSPSRATRGLSPAGKSPSPSPADRPATRQ